jgi:hypothetical protein
MPQNSLDSTKIHEFPQKSSNNSRITQKSTNSPKFLKIPQKSTNFQKKVSKNLQKPQNFPKNSLSCKQNPEPSNPAIKMTTIFKNNVPKSGGPKF